MSPLKITNYFLTSLTVLASASLLCMMMVITVNVVGRIFFRTPLLGAIEIAGLMGVIFVSIALGKTENEHGNVVVKLLVMQFPARVRALAESVTGLLSLIGVVILCYATFKDAFLAASFQEKTQVLEIQTTPFKFIWAAGTLILCLMVLKNAIISLKRAFKK